MVVWGTLAPRCPLCKPTTTGIYRRFTNTYKTAAIQHHVSDEERTHKACQDNSNWIRCNQSAKLLSATCIPSAELLSAVSDEISFVITTTCFRSFCYIQIKRLNIDMMSSHFVTP